MASGVLGVSVSLWFLSVSVGLLQSMIDDAEFDPKVAEHAGLPESIIYMSSAVLLGSLALVVSGFHIVSPLKFFDQIMVLGPVIANIGLLIFARKYSRSLR